MRMRPMDMKFRLTAALEGRVPDHVFHITQSTKGISVKLILGAKVIEEVLSIHDGGNGLQLLAQRMTKSWTDLKEQGSGPEAKEPQ